MTLTDTFVLVNALRSVVREAGRQARISASDYFRTSSLGDLRIPRQPPSPYDGSSGDIPVSGQHSDAAMGAPLSDLSARASAAQSQVHVAAGDSTLTRGSSAQPTARETVVCETTHSGRKARATGVQSYSFQKLGSPPIELRLGTLPRVIPLQAGVTEGHNHAEVQPVQRELYESKMPSTRISRTYHYGMLALGLGVGALGQAIRNIGKSASTAKSSLIASKANMDRLVSKLSKMRGAALKLGQMLSLQDSSSLSPELEELLNRVQNAAHYMPVSQMKRVMDGQLGPEWRTKFSEFDEVPFAAASIGQVHVGRLDPLHPELAGKYDFDQVAVKIQYPGAALSVDSDLDNLSTLLMMSRLLPKGLYLENTIASARKDLKLECDYEYEARCMQQFGSLFASDPDFRVPGVVPELSARQVLTTELVPGIPLAQAAKYDQDTRNWIAQKMLDLCLRELFEFSIMQTDPNWSNFLYSHRDRKISLIDFGASRTFSPRFLDLYSMILLSAAHNDRDACLRYSKEIGYLTGHETSTMINAHVDSVMVLGEPFRHAGEYDFSNQTITSRIRQTIPVMLQHRLTPPPEETYSLHRKMSGAYLLCAKLNARVDCKRVFDARLDQYLAAKGSRADGLSDIAEVPAPPTV
ncbi:hypothetical protein EV182_003482 [Spiromyces aspiralis]|uniref:Uncharacterized protein n=1 Tax=Spiromyces aspiralis TaxID=68401 RepID=A0ACC1HCQ9_9FUNG|nr:hypothetical protein EV182_003482 [Spiromyces aspiralis]